MVALLGAVLLLCSLASPASARDVPSVTMQGAACETCLFSWRVAEDVLADQQVVQSLVTFADGLCPSLPSSASEKCKNLAEGLLPVVVEWLALPSTAQQFCADVCRPVAQLPAGMVVQKPKAVQDGVQCAMCTLVVGEVQEVLNSSTVVAKINKMAESACAQLPPDMADTCTAFVDKYGLLLEQLISQAPAEEVCEVLGVCGAQLIARLSKAQFHSLPPSASSSDAFFLRGAWPGRTSSKGVLVPHKLIRSVQTARLSAAPGVPKGALGDSCDMCKLAVIEAHSLVTNPSVQQSIINYTATLCAQFQSFNDTCILYVQTYAPVVFSLLQQYLVPDTLCVQIGVCPTNPPVEQELDTATLSTQLTQTMTSVVARLQGVLGTRVTADHLVASELAAAAANAWSHSMLSAQQQQEEEAESRRRRVI